MQTVLIHLRRQLPIAELFRLVSLAPELFPQLRYYATNFEPGLLNDYYYQNDQVLENVLQKFESMTKMVMYKIIYQLEKCSRPPRN